MPALSPANKLLAAAAFVLCVCALSVWISVRQPHLGVTLEPDFEHKRLTVIGAHGPGASVPVGAQLLAVNGVELQATDLIEEPDFFDEYAQMRDFFARQSELSAALHGHDVSLKLLTADGTQTAVTVLPAQGRPLSTLPAVFWFQLFAGSAGFLIAAWVLVLRAREVAVRAFAAMGAMFPLFTVPAAIYSTRELAMDGTLFRVLSSLNHTGAMLYGCGLVALFLSYPRPLIPTRWLWAVPGVMVPWLLTDVVQLAPNQDFGSRIPISLEMLSAIVLGIVQWRVTRKDPTARAALRWFGLSILVGSGAFVFTVVGSTLLGLFPPLAQGYAFGFFLMMDVGLALGLRRFRLFELDEWAFRIFLWVGGAMALLAIDAGLIALLQLRGDVSLGLALVAAGFVYLPLRQLLFSRLVARRTVGAQELFPRVLDVAFAPNDDERGRGWIALWKRVFDPLNVEPLSQGPSAVSLEADGLTMLIPSVGAASAVKISYPWQGKGLVGPRHVALATQLVTLMRHADGSRLAYERGVREERGRIASDLHDDVGARLLSALNEPELPAARQRIQQAMADIRSIINALTGQRVALDDALANLRHETAQRLSSAKIQLEWPVDAPLADATLDASVNRHLVSMVRELTSNAIRHSGARTVKVDVALDDGRHLLFRMRDDGVGFQPDAGKGHGLSNLRDRASKAGGSATFGRDEAPSLVELRLPVSLSRSVQS